MNAAIPDTTPADAARRSDGAVLLDVREQDEWDAGHAPGARHVPLGDLRPEMIPAGAAAMCICRSGRRSGEATHRLRTAGVDAVNVAGGMLAWEAADLPVVRDDGRSGTVA